MMMIIVMVVRETDSPGGHVTVRAVPIPEVAVPTPSPRVDDTIRGDGERVLGPAGDTHDVGIRERGDGHGLEDVVDVAQPELTVLVSPKGEELAASGGDEGMGVPTRHLVDGDAGEARNGVGDGEVEVRAVSQAAKVAPTPTVYLALGGGDRDGVLGAAGDRAYRTVGEVIEVGGLVTFLRKPEGEFDGEGFAFACAGWGVGGGELHHG